MKEFIRRRDNGELLSNQTQHLLATARSTHPLSKSEDGFVHFGDSIAILSQHANRRVSCNTNAGASENLAISAAPADAPPQSRSIFKIGGPESQHGDVLRYGDRFTLDTTDAHGPARALYSERVSLHGGASFLSGKQAVYAVQTEGASKHNTLWEIVSFDPQLRLESAGQPVPAGSPILVRHVATNFFLALLHDQLVRSQLGAEPEVVCHTFLNVHKAETEANHWLLETSQ
jgi:hypothetical protein